MSITVIFAVIHTCSRPCARVVQWSDAAAGASAGEYEMGTGAGAPENGSGKWRGGQQEARSTVEPQRAPGHSDTWTRRLTPQRVCRGCVISTAEACDKVAWVPARGHLGQKPHAFSPTAVTTSELRPSARDRGRRGEGRSNDRGGGKRARPACGGRGKWQEGLSEIDVIFQNADHGKCPFQHPRSHASPSPRHFFQLLSPAIPFHPLLILRSAR